MTLDSNFNNIGFNSPFYIETTRYEHRGLVRPKKNLYNTTRTGTHLLAFFISFVLVCVGYLSISEDYINNWGLFGTENYLAFDW